MDGEEVASICCFKLAHCHFVPSLIIATVDVIVLVAATVVEIVHS